MAWEGESLPNNLAGISFNLIHLSAQAIVIEPITGSPVPQLLSDLLLPGYIEQVTKSLILSLWHSFLRFRVKLFDQNKVLCHISPLVMRGEVFNLYSIEK